MSLFPRSMFTSEYPRVPTGGEFTPLFRLLDDYASHQLSRAGDSPSGGLASFQPKFDVKETKENYELHGELPGIDQKDVQIEFSDASTLVIKGRTERHTESGTPPAGLIGDASEQAKLTDSAASTPSSPTPETYQKPTVEEEESTSASTPSSTVAKTADDASKTPTVQKKQKQPQHHYWLTERSIGEFHRAFSFPARVDHENVKASLKNGVLSVVVPKSQAPTTRRINIE